jgi:hypothetical protein
LGIVVVQSVDLSLESLEGIESSVLSGVFSLEDFEILVLQSS